MSYLPRQSEVSLQRPPEELFNEKVRESKESYQRMAHWTPERKATANRAYYEMLWFANAGQWEAEKKEEAGKIALQFFTENIRRTIIDLNLWKPLLWINPADDPRPMGNTMRIAGMNTLTQMMRQDMWNARHIHQEQSASDEIVVADMPL